MSMSNGTPDIASLLIDEHDEGADVQTIQEAAQNALEPLLCGLEAIGYMLWHVTSSKHVMGIDEDHLSDLGWLLQTLSHQAQHFQRIGSNAQGILAARELAKRGMVTVTNAEANLISSLKHLGTPKPIRSKREAAEGATTKQRRKKKAAAAQTATA